MEKKQIWDKDRPKGLGKPKELTPMEKRSAMRRAQKTGRPYPNLIDNIMSAQGKK
jgi:hypothetical protein